MTAQERLDYLLATVSTQTGKQVIVADIIEAIGMESARVVLGTLQAASSQDPVLAAAYQALVTVGISLSGDDRQSMLDHLAVAGSWSNEVRDAVKALGVTVTPRWQTEGYDSEPTLEQVQAEIDAQALVDAKLDWRARFDAVLNQIGTAEQADGLAALQTLASEMAGD